MADNTISKHTAALPVVAQGIFDQVIDAMSHAEGMHGPQLIEDYLNLMQAIAAEAMQRTVNARHSESMAPQDTVYHYGFGEFSVQTTNVCADLPCRYYALVPVTLDWT